VSWRTRRPGATLPLSTDSRSCDGSSKRRQGEVLWMPLLRMRDVYEAALVLPLADDLSEMVQRLRGTMLAAFTAPAQLRPHLTLLFLGRMSGEHLCTLWNLVSGISWAPVTVVLRGFGCFRSGTRITNIHLRVEESSSLMYLHRKLLRLCRGVPWFQPGSYVGARYVPHVSIVDRCSVEQDRVHLPKRTWAKRKEILAERALMAKNLGKAGRHLLARRKEEPKGGK
jgi:2'-5' RNA ligase